MKLLLEKIERKQKRDAQCKKGTFSQTGTLKALLYQSTMIKNSVD